MKPTVAILSILSLVAYQYVRANKGVELNELYFVIMSLSIAAYSFSSITKKDTLFASSMNILSGSFFISTVIIYLKRWVICGDGSTNYYTAICIATILTFIYLICYAIKHNRNH